eukprot:403367957
MLFHLGDAFFFMNELIKTQPTSVEESDVYNKIVAENKASNRRYGRTVIASVTLPFLYVCGTYKGYFWKLGLFYIIYREADALYDAGIYLRFLVNAPRQFRYMLALDDSKNFGTIQTKLFVKYCAEVEMKKARGEMPRKAFTDLVVVRSFRNQLRDTYMQFKNFYTYMKNKNKKLD